MTALTSPHNPAACASRESMLRSMLTERDAYVTFLTRRRWWQVWRKRTKMLEPVMAMQRAGYERAVRDVARRAELFRESHAPGTASHFDTVYAWLKDQ